MNRELMIEFDIYEISYNDYKILNMWQRRILIIMVPPCTTEKIKMIMGLHSHIIGTKIKTDKIKNYLF